MKELKRFIRFNYRLYDDMLNTFNKKKNAAFEFCEAEYFLAYQDNKIVGRVAAIINHKANKTWDKKNVRFGWIDFIDNPEVSDALIHTVEEWGKERGMTHIQGPLGFTDFDAEGMLIEGFDQLSTMATIYNYPYYPQHMERMGFEKEADWWNIRSTFRMPYRTSTNASPILSSVNIISRLKNIHLQRRLPATMDRPSLS